MVKLRAFFLLLLLAVPLGAQTSGSDKVSVSLSSPSIALDETATMTVTVSGLADAIDVPLPETRDGGLQFTPSGRRYAMTSINGQTNSSVQLDFIITPLRTGRHLIEPITGNVAGIPFTTDSQRLEVTDVGTGTAWSSSSSTTTTGQTAPGTSPWSYPGMGYPSQPAIPEPREDDVLLEAVVEPTTVYKHQPIFYNLRLLTAIRLLTDPRYSPIAPTGFLRLQFDQENGSEDRNGRYYSVSSVKTAYFPLNEGDYTLDPTRVQVSGGIFGLPKDLSTAAQPIKVLPFPSKGRPQSFTGAVGQQFEIRARLKNPEISLGGNAEIEVVVKGDGHLDLVPYPYLPDWAGLEKKQLTSPSTTKVENGQIVSQRTYNFRVKPSKVGNFDLSGIALGYFNPSEKRYEVVKTPALTLQVTPNKNSDPEAVSGDAEVSESDLPQEAPGATTGRLPQLPRAALAAGLALLFVGSLAALPKRHSSWLIGKKGKASRVRGYKSLSDLMIALEELAPGSDVTSRQNSLRGKGWSEPSISKLESLRRRASQAIFGGPSGKDDSATLEALSKELTDLRKEAKR